MLQIYSDLVNNLTPCERYDRVARIRGWMPIGLSDVSRSHPLVELRAAEKNCRRDYPRLGYALVCEIAWRETQRQMIEASGCWHWNENLTEVRDDERQAQAR